MLKIGSLSNMSNTASIRITMITSMLVVKLDNFC